MSSSVILFNKWILSAKGFGKDNPLYMTGKGLWMEQQMLRRRCRLPGCFDHLPFGLLYYHDPDPCSLHHIA